ncbi:hypothetical protein HOLleu_23314 [Holothuria leucospilota]|uniref:Uncharacterized protein n=1 Tax=Holothuria leucospilota TaxID=206669 RepID=A0A9Q1H2U0_HOLLE|nr:hypothetical protein HOLleu_23314 [Holothuria leucospilota]
MLDSFILPFSSYYCQVMFDPDSLPKTVFTASFRLYEFKRLPVGDYNAPVTFQRLIIIKMFS